MLHFHLRTSPPSRAAGFFFQPLRSEIEKAVFAAIRRASSLLSSDERRPGGRDTETGISSILCERKRFDMPAAG